MASTSRLPSSSSSSISLLSTLRLSSLTPILSPLLALALIPRTSAYTWSFHENPAQCANLTIAVSGTDGKPPYRVLILPFGPSPLADNIEARRILDVAFPADQGSVSFQLRYPENSQFVAVVSDATGFGSGGTSVAAQVTSSSDASCFDAKTMVSPQFVFSIEPPNQVVQCEDTRIWWDPATVQGTPNFLGVIPGGQSFAVPRGSLTDVAAQGRGFTWKPSLRGGTTLILVGGDNRGNGTAGSTLNVVSSGINNDGSCLSDSSPSSTPGSPAGGSYPTSTNLGSTTTGGGGGSSSSAKVGAIVGGVLGGLALLIALICLLFFFRRKQKKQRMVKERPDLLNAGEYGDEDDGDEAPAPADGRARRNELPQYYQPEPFMVPDPTLRLSAEGGGMAEEGEDVEARRPMSGGTTTTTSFYTRTGTPDLVVGGGLATPSVSNYGGGAGRGGTGSSAGGGGGEGGRRKGGAPRPLRPVNIIQHDDAGPSVSPEEEEDKEGEEPETIELPPAYTAVGRNTARGAGGAPSAPPAGA